MCVSNREDAVLEDSWNIMIVSVMKLNSGLALPVKVLRRIERHLLLNWKLNGLHCVLIVLSKLKKKIKIKINVSHFLRLSLRDQ